MNGRVVALAAIATVSVSACAAQVSHTGGAVQVLWRAGTVVQHDALTRSCGLAAPSFRADVPASAASPGTSTYALPDPSQQGLSTVRTCLERSPLVVPVRGVDGLA